MTEEEITHYLFLPDTPNLNADVALVFGVNRFWRATDKAIELYKNNYAPKLLFSGGINKHNGVHEGPLMALYAEDFGVPTETILIEDEATNTLENVLNSLAIMEEQFGIINISRITLVCSSHHARRAMMTAKKQLPQHIKLKLATYPIGGITKETWTKTEKGRELVAKELDRIERYLAKGDIAEL